MGDHPLRLAFAGTPEFAATALDAIVDAGFEVALVLTQPDRPSGRGMKLNASAVKRRALAHGLPVDQPERLKNEAQRAALRACTPDLLVVAAYGLILPPEVLALPRLGCINIHASLLPRWRGAAPIHRAIEAGDAETGITIMQMEEGLDTGAILASKRMPIRPSDTTATLHDRLAVLGGSLVVEVLQALAHGPVDAHPQPDEGVTYASKISRAEAVADWRLPAEQIERRLRAFDPFPGLQSEVAGQTVKFWQGVVNPRSGAPGEVLSADADGVVIACGDGAIRFTVLQRPGSRRLPAADFLRGFALAPGERLAPAAD